MPVLFLTDPPMKNRREAVLHRFLVQRYGGLGDVLMLLAALREAVRLGFPPAQVSVDPRYAPLVLASPAVSAVLHPQQWQLACQEPETVAVDVNAVDFGLSEQHQVRAYLAALGIHTPPRSTCAELLLPRSLVHRAQASLQGWGRHKPLVLVVVDGQDANRHWPHSRELAQQLAAQGVDVAVLGQHRLQPSLDQSCLDLTAQTDLLLLAGLISQAQVLVAADSGPIQLALALGTAVVGLYSVVPAQRRLALGSDDAVVQQGIEPSCPFFPCYDHARQQAAAAGGFNQPGAPNVSELAQWCLNSERYACLKRLSAATVAEQVHRLLGRISSESSQQGQGPV